MKTLCWVAFIWVGVIFPGMAEEPEAKSPPLLTRYFRVEGMATCCGPGPMNDSLPLILDGLEDNEITRTNSARGFLEARGASFPLGSGAVYFLQPSLLGVTNTAENLLKIGEILKQLDLNARVPLIRIEVRVVEFPPEAEDKLPGKATFAALRNNLGEGLKTVCTTSVVTMTGNRTTHNLDSPPAKSSREKTAKAEGDPQGWPPPIDTERTLLEVEPNLEPGEHKVTMQISFHYASPAKAGQPTLRAELSSTFAVEDGTIFKASTFSVRDGKQNAPHFYAVLVRPEIVNERGKTKEQSWAEFDASRPKPKKP